MSDPKPLPCPFCGESRRIWVYPAHKGPSAEIHGWHFACLNPECDFNPTTKTLWSTKEEAIASWNRRAEVKV